MWAWGDTLDKHRYDEVGISTAGDEVEWVEGGSQLKVKKNTNLNGGL